MLENYQNLIERLKKQSRALAIWSWHETTLAKMKVNLIDLRRKNSLWTKKSLDTI